MFCWEILYSPFSFPLSFYSSCLIFIFLAIPSLFSLIILYYGVYILLVWFLRVLGPLKRRTFLVFPLSLSDWIRDACLCGIGSCLCRPCKVWQQKNDLNLKDGNRLEFFLFIILLRFFCYMEILFFLLYGNLYHEKISQFFIYATKFNAVILLSQAESAIAALNCSGAVLGSLPIRLFWRTVQF